MRILLTGATGRFGTMFRQVCPHEVVPMPRSAIADAAPLINSVKPDWIVNAAALTDVDACERDPAAAQQSNAVMPGRLAKACAETGVRLLHLSTDYVFDGKRGNYRETDTANPISVYGASKLAGERAVQAALPSAIIARTSVVFGTPGKPDFVSWVAQEIRAGAAMKIVHQRISPTSTPDLAAQVVALIDAGAEGMYHTAGADRLTRLEMVQAIAGIIGKDAVTEEVPMSAMTWPAARPEDSSLNVEKVQRVRKPMKFADAVAQYLEGLA